MAGLSAEIGRKIRDAVDFHKGESEEHSRLAEDIDDAWQQHDYEWLYHARVLNRRDMEEIAQAMVAANPGGDPRIADALNRVFRAQLKRLTVEGTSAGELHNAATAAHGVGASAAEIERAQQDAYKYALEQSIKPKRRKRTSRRAR